MRDAFVRSVVLRRDDVEDFDRYPFSIPAVRTLEELALDPHVTFLTGENGSGKSTLVEAIALAAGFSPEGGSRNMAVSTRASHSELHEHLRLVRGTRTPRTGYFLRAESFYNVATRIEELDESPGAGRRLVDSYGGASHSMSSRTASRSSPSSSTASVRTASMCSTSRRRRSRCAAASR